MFDVSKNYQYCSVCGNLADDGGLRNELFTCHDCLDQEYKKGVDKMLDNEKAVNKYFDELEKMKVKIDLISNDKDVKIIKTVSDVGSLKVGNDDFSLLIPNGYGDGEMTCYITTDVNISEKDGFKYFSLLSGKFNIYDYDCGDNVIYTTSDNAYQVWFGNGYVILNKNGQ